MVGPTQDNKPTTEKPVSQKEELDKVGNAIKIDRNKEQDQARGCAEPACWDKPTAGVQPTQDKKTDVARGCAEPGCWDKS